MKLTANTLFRPFGKGRLTKTWRIMRITSVLLTIFCIQVSAGSISQTITLSAEKIPLDKIFQAIEKQTGYFVVYFKKDIRAAKPLTIHAQNESLVEFLKDILWGQQLDFTIVERTISIKKKNPTPNLTPQESFTFPSPPPVDVRGRVLNRLGAPISGVSISLKGSSIGTMTSEDGRFAISIPGEISEKILVFSYVDYKTQEVRIATRFNIDITLESADKSLGEVVVVGYSSIKKESVTGSVGQVSAEKLTDASSPNIASLLQGKVAGVDVISGGGKPGRLPTIAIRGRASISTSLVPIWVVDGVIMPEDPNLNPNDVESITVLKDASAASLYGSRGANGVIVVTTKTAKGIDKKDLTVSSKLSVNKFNPGKFEVMNSQDMVNMYNLFINPSSVPSWFNESLTSRDFDWVKNGTHNTLGQEYNVGYSGTTGKARIYAAGNYFKEDGTIKGYSYERYSARLNLDYPINDKITFSPKVSTSYVKIDNRQHVVYRMYTGLPWDNPYGEDGKPFNPNVPGGPFWYGRDLNNYTWDQSLNYSKEDRFNISSNFDLKYEITKNFAFKSTNNVTYYHLNGLEYKDPFSRDFRADVGRITNSASKRITRFTNQMITYTGKSGRHEINALAAYEFNDFRLSDISAVGKGIVPGISVLSGTATPISTRGNTTEYAFRSYLFNANYGFDDNRFVGQFSFRRDGSSRFGSNNKYGNFWSVSGAWNIHRESFFHSTSIDYLRLKAAYGGVGNTPDAFYPQYDVYSVNAQYNGSPTAVPSALGNPNLSWEKTYSTNIGFDIGLFKRIDLSVEYYDKNTSDLLYLVPLPTVSGYTGKYENIGAVSNKGFEISLGGDVVKTSNFNWRIDVNVGTYKNRIKELYKGNSQINGFFIYTVGEDINTYFLRKWAGVDPENGDPLWEIVDPVTKAVTLTNNYSAATLQKSGVTTPDYYGGISTSFNYKSLSLRANFAFRQGTQILEQGSGSYETDGAFPTYNHKKLGKGQSFWSPDNRNATHPAPAYGGNHGSSQNSTRYLYDASFLRMRNITLAYNLPEGLVKRIKLKGIDAFISGDNLFIATPFTGVDPEFQFNTDFADYFGYSFYGPPKRITFGINVHL